MSFTYLLLSLAVFVLIFVIYSLLRFPKDYTKATKWQWHRKAAEQGDAVAQYNLGQLYAEGKGVLEDYKKAIEWYRKAAEQGYASALNNLSFMYFNGYGVKEDLPTAYALILLSTNEGGKKQETRQTK